MLLSKETEQAIIDSFKDLDRWELVKGYEARDGGSLGIMMRYCYSSLWRDKITGTIMEFESDKLVFIDTLEIKLGDSSIPLYAKYMIEGKDYLKLQAVVDSINKKWSI